MPRHASDAGNARRHTPRQRRRGRRLRCCFGVAAYAFASISAAAAETLGDFMAREGIPAATRPRDDLAQIVSGAERLQSARTRTLAAAVGRDDQRRPSFVVFVNDAPGTRWRTAQLAWPAGGPCDGGALVGLSASAHFLFLEAHINPSASCTMVVAKRDLSMRGEIAGWIVAELRDDRVVYQHNEIHFAPTHYVELSVYDAATRRSRKIYPTEPCTPIRCRHIRQVQLAYDRCLQSDDSRAACGGAFAANNHHGDATLFDCSLDTPVAANPATDSIAFTMSFADIVTQHPSVVYVYRDVSDPRRMAVREILAADLDARYGVRPLATYLQPRMLDRLFATPRSSAGRGD